MTASPLPDDVIPTPPIRSGGAASDSVSATEFRAALADLTTAVSIIATRGRSGIAGLTCSAVCAVSHTPATLVACVSRVSAAHAVIVANGNLCINCLPATRQDLSQLFAGVGQVPMSERFAADLWTALATGAPYCKDALVAFDCDLMETREIGTHSVLIARVLATAQGTPAEPLVYHRQHYATTRAI